MQARLAPPDTPTQDAAVPRAITLPSPVGRVRSRPGHRLRELRAPLLIACTYYPAARLGMLFQFPHTEVAPVWPASGLAVASLLVLGRRHWPALAIAAFLADLTNGTEPALSAAMAAGSTGEYLVAATLLRRASDAVYWGTLSGGEPRRSIEALRLRYVTPAEFPATIFPWCRDRVADALAVAAGAPPVHRVQPVSSRHVLFFGLRWVAVGVDRVRRLR